VYGAFGAGGQDPDYRRESVYRFGNALQQVAQEIQGYQDRKQLLALSEAQRFFRDVQVDPTLANTWGPDISRRLGGQFPEIPYLVQAAQQRQQQAGAIQGGWQKYLAALDTAKGHLSALQGAADQQPDQLTIPAQLPPGWPGEAQGPPQTVPNPAKQPLLQAIQAAQSVGLPRTAMNSLSAQDEAYARLYADSVDPKKTGLASMLPPPVQGFDIRKAGSGPAGKVQIFAALNGLDPTTMNLWKPEQQQAVRQFLDLDPTGAETWKLGTQFQNSKSLEATRHQHQIDSEILHNRDAMGRIYQSHALLGAQEDINFKRKVQLLDQQGKLFGNNTGDPLMAAQSAATLNQKQWEQQFGDAKKANPNDVPGLTALLKQRPGALPPGAAPSIADAITAEVGMGLLNPAQAASEAQKRALGVQQIMSTMPSKMQGNMGDQAVAGAIAAGHRRILAQWIGAQSDPSVYQDRYLKATQAYDGALKQGANPMAALQAASGLALPSPQVRQQVRDYLRRAGPSAQGGSMGLQVAPQPIVSPATEESAAPAEEPPEE